MWSVLREWSCREKIKFILREIKFQNNHILNVVFFVKSLLNIDFLLMNLIYCDIYIKLEFFKKI